MAVAFTARANIGATGTVVTTASFTPSANSRLFAIAGARAGGAVVPVVTDSLGGTWTLLPTSNIDAGNSCGALYYRDIGASPAAMTVTATSTGATQTGVMCFDVTGHSIDLSNFAFNTNAAGDPSLNLAAISAGGYGIATFIGNAGAAPTVTPAGYTSAYNGAIATNLRMALFVDPTSPGTAQAWTSGSTDSIAYGLEIKEFVSAGGGSALKVWDGSAWVEKPSKVWDGAVWAEKPLKVWNGGAWI
jgi:hypothetical protein